jgi:hypothetical protein
MPKQKSIDDFIKELQSISPDKRKLPLITYAPNGMEVYPSIKMKFTMGMPFNVSGNKVEAMVIIWQD